MQKHALENRCRPARITIYNMLRRCGASGVAFGWKFSGVWQAAFMSGSPDLNFKTSNLGRTKLEIRSTADLDTAGLPLSTDKAQA
jgi:hypothetical protein